jgi:hypothetical protein
MACPAHVDGTDIVYDIMDPDFDWRTTPLDDPLWEEDNWEYIELPPELVIQELLELDLDDAEDIASFLTEYGAIQRPFPDVPEDDFTSAQYGYEERSVPVADIRRWLDDARLLAQHFVAHASGGDVLEPWKARGHPPLDERYAWASFATMLNHALRLFQVRVELDIFGHDEDEDEMLGGAFPDLYEALCLQIHQLLVSGLPVHHCANDTCQRPFVKQHGTAEHGQYRTKGVAYCSRACAKAQAQREYRRRQRKDQE